MSLVGQLDAKLSEFLAGWDIYSTLIVTTLCLILVYPLFFSKDPDTHPLLLARQANISPVRQIGESAVYRALEIPYGYPLRTGLNVRDPSAPKWSAGRDGDLRDIWRQAVRGPVRDDGSPTGDLAKVMIVLGREKVIGYNLDEVSQEMNIIGQFVKENGGKRVVIALSNSVEFIAAVFGESLTSSMG